MAKTKKLRFNDSIGDAKKQIDHKLAREFKEFRLASSLASKQFLVEVLNTYNCAFTDHDLGIVGAFHHEIKGYLVAIVDYDRFRAMEHRLEELEQMTKVRVLPIAARA